MPQPADSCVVGIGETTLDQIGVGVASFGRASELATFTVQAGGAVATALATVAALGGRARLFTRLGNDAFGRTAIQRLRSFGVDTSPVLVEEGRMSATRIILIEEETRSRREHFTRGDVAPLEASEIPTNLLLGAGLLLVDGSDPVVQTAVAHRAKSQGIRVMLDARDCAAQAAELWRLADVVVASERVASEIVNSNDMEKALRELQRRGPQIAVVTLGEEGAAALSGGTLLREDGLALDVVDKLGSGDAFRGALAWALVQDWPMERALPLANATGALNCRALGGQSGIPSLDEALSAARLRPI
jgi:sugar/nucleoside kinase (ribokinase family)